MINTNKIKNDESGFVERDICQGNWFCQSHMEGIATAGVDNDESRANVMTSQTGNKKPRALGFDL